ncbi:sensor histidine kinase [Tropicimonas sp.]|uniref:sensor histidine kinase n=1 Tax=Tropicimonas sp. TaxID=2067044 RepID=UPI003A85C99A
MSERNRVPPSAMDDSSWAEVLEAVDRTYAELVAYQDQLEQRNTELLGLRRLLGSILESMTDYLIAVDRNGRIEEASTSFAAFAGIEKSGLEGCMLADYLNAEERERLNAALALANLGQGSELELNMTPAGNAEPIEFHIAPRLDRRRKGIGAVLTGRPLGELRRMYSELTDSHDALKQAQGQLVRNEKLASLGRLLAGVAHELNNPISFVYANTHALEKYLGRFETYFEHVQSGASREDLIALRSELKLDRELRNLRTAISGAHEGAERVRDIVADLRRLSSDGSGEFATIDLVETARIAASWIERGCKSAVTIRIEGETTCPVMGRSGHIQQVLLNLVQNAVDATEGQPDAEVRIRAVREPGFAYLDVSDNGPGVSEDAAPRIFDPFYTTKPVGQGTGLGLSISHKIAVEHGGMLQLLPSDRGATFRLTLPGVQGA